MEKEQIDKMMTEGKIDELSQILEAEMEEVYDEYSMLTLAGIYLCDREVKKAKRLLKRLKMLYPAGDFSKEEKEMIEAIECERTDEFVSSMLKKEEKKEENLSKLVLKYESAEPKEILDNINAYFKNIVGMDNAKRELDMFYKRLKFIEKRKEHDFNMRTPFNANFAIAGARGTGKTMIASVIAKMLYDFEVTKEEKPKYMEARELLQVYSSNGVPGVENILKGVQGAVFVLENWQAVTENSTITTQDCENISVALSKLMDSRNEETFFIITGTSESIATILAVGNPLNERVKNRIEIEKYSTIELFDIACRIAKDNAYLVHEDAKKKLIRILDKSRKYATFANAVTIKEIIDKAADRMAQEYFDKENLSEADMVYLREKYFEDDSTDENLEELLNKLDNMIGLDGVKEQIRKRINAVTTEKEAYESGALRILSGGSMHMVFTGNPGTGKTTVARIIGKIYQALGILPRGSCVVECTRGDLVGKYEGHTADIVKAKVKEAVGGVLFIDEAYSLCRDKNDPFGKEAVDQLVPLIEEYKDEMLVILAGYRKEMQEFLKMNSGLASRFRNYIDFEDYTIDEMTDIFIAMAQEKNMRFEDGIRESLRSMLEVKSKEPDFGNGRGVRNKFEDVLEVMDERLSQKRYSGEALSKEDYDTITKSDIQIVADRKLKGEKSLEELLKDLDELTGLQAVKDKVHEMVDNIQVAEYKKKNGMGENKEKGTLHLLLKGNAGTGKTTVARLIGEIYTKLGVLKKNVFVEVSRSSLVMGYVGQTAIKVVEKLDEASGGILFVDEAYSLKNGENDEFGTEAINTLVKEIDDRRNDLMVILAGYGSDMDAFMRANQGLRSRISNEIVFEDYSVDEMLQIFECMVKKKGYILGEGVKEGVRERLSIESKAEGFGNGRGVRNVLERIEGRMNTRMATAIRNGKSVTKKEVLTITNEDIG